MPRFFVFHGRATGLMRRSASAGLYTLVGALSLALVGCSSATSEPSGPAEAAGTRTVQDYFGPVEVP